MPFTVCSLFACLSATACLLLPSLAHAQTSYPMLLSLSPAAAQAGTTSEHTLVARGNLFGAYRVLVSGDGVTAEVVSPPLENAVKPAEAKPGETPPAPNVETLKLKITVAADARPGVRDFRLGTPQGATTLGQLVIVRDPVAIEQAKNDTPAEAQPVSLPATLCGVIEKAEDVDYFKFQAAAGQALTFHVRAMRLQDKIHDLQSHVDPMLTIRHAAGSTVAAADNHIGGDPLLFHRFEHAGEYLLEIRDVRYQGNPHWQYAIEIHSRPHVTAAHPLGVERGKEAKLELVGFNLPAEPQIAFTPPTGISPSRTWTELPLSAEVKCLVPLVLSDVPVEVEAAADNNAPAGAQPVSVPGGISGRIEGASDVDCYSFDAKKGDAFQVEVIARRMESMLDPQLRLLDATGKELAQNDDFQVGRRQTSDPQLPHWVAPADGKYTLELRDLHLRGGADFVYLLKLAPSKPRFALFVDTDKTQLTPGTSSVLFVRSVRAAGFRGDIQLGIAGLPPGVTAECGRIVAATDQDGAIEQFAANGGAMRDGCIVLHAAKDAPLGIANVQVTGAHTQPVDEATSVTTTIVAANYQEIYNPGGGRAHWPVETHAVAVGAPNDLRGVTINASEISLKPGESKQIDVMIERSPVFNQNVTLDVVYGHLGTIFGDTLPRGVTVDAAASKTLLDGKSNQGHIVLKAADTAPPSETQLVPVMAHVSLNFVMKSTYVAGPLRVKVLPK